MLRIARPFAGVKIAAIEPSRVMIAQRPRSSAPALQAVAEHIPLRDRCADAALAVLTVHHWSDVAAGLAEMRRIARRRLVFFTWYPQTFASFCSPRPARKRCVRGSAI